MASIKQLTGAISVTLLTAGCTIQSSTRPVSKAIQPSAQAEQVSPRLTAQQEMELYQKKMELYQRGMENATEAARTVLNAPYFDDSYTVAQPSSHQSIAQANDAPMIVVGQDGAFLGVVSSDRFAPNSICNELGSFGNSFSSTSVLNQYAKYGGTFSNLGAYNPNAQKPPLIIQNRQAIGLLTKNRRLQGGVDPDVFFNQVCGR